MKITLTKLKIRDFQGMRGEHTFDFHEGRNIVSGKNGLGKSTIASALSWLLFNKNSEGSGKFDEKPRNEKYELIHNLVNTVEASFLIEGNAYTIRREQHETQTKVRGSLELGTINYTSNYYVDGNKYSVSDYKKFISDRFGQSQTMLEVLLNPLLFHQLKADEQRALITGMVKPVTTEEVAKQYVNSWKFYQSLTDEEKNLEAYRQHIAYSIKQVKADLSVIPSKIEEHEMILQSVDTLDMEELNAFQARLTQEIESLEKSKVIGTNEHLQKRIDEIQAEILQIRKDVDQKNRDSLQRHNEAISNAYNEQLDMQRKALDKSRRCEDIARRLDEIKAAIVKGADEWNLLQHTSDTCPTCGRKYDEVILEQINNQTAEAKKQLMQRASDLKAESKTLNDELVEVEKEHDSYVEKAEALKTKQQELRSQDVTIKIEDDAKYQALSKELQSIYDEMMSAESGVNEGLDAQILDLKTQLQGVYRSIAQAQSAKNAKERIKELEKQEKELNIQLAEMEQKEDLAREICDRQLQSYEYRVNDLFKLAKFTLFENYQNGAKRPTCIMYVGGASYNGSLNMSDKINASIDVANAISKHYDICLPMFVDNAESINEVLESAGQQIILKVTEDTTLKIE